MEKDSVIEFESIADIEEQASLWLARIDGGSLSKSQRSDFEAWYRSNPRHASIFEDLASVLGHADILADVKDIAASPIVSQSLKADRSFWQTAPRKSLVGGLVAASLVFFLIAYQLVPALAPTNTVAHYEAEVATVQGEQRTIDLSDGTVITLNTRSKAEISYSPRLRGVMLVEGEAFFEVAPNPSVPFVVETPFGSVRAVGTEFSVKVEHGVAEVLVTEGRVEAKPIGGNDTSATRYLEAGDTANISIEMVTEMHRDLEAIQNDLDWRDGILSFNGESMEQVVQKVSRYTDLEIIIDDELLRAQPIGGYFKIGETEALFNALKIMADVEILRPNPGQVILVLADGNPD